MGKASPLHGWSERKVQHFIALYTADNDLTPKDFMRLFKISDATIRKYANELGIKRHPETMRRIRARVGRQNAQKARIAFMKRGGPKDPKWPPHRFEDDPRAAEDSRFAQPMRRARPAPDMTLGGVASGAL